MYVQNDLSISFKGLFDVESSSSNAIDPSSSSGKVQELFGAILRDISNMQIDPGLQLKRNFNSDQEESDHLKGVRQIVGDVKELHLSLSNDRKNEKVEILEVLDTLCKMKGISEWNYSDSLIRDHKSTHFKLKNFGQAEMEKLNRAFVNSLILCIYRDEFKEVKKLLTLMKIEGIDINSSGENGLKALVVSATKGNKEIFNLLLKQKNIDINVCQESPRVNSLLAAVNKGHVEIAKQLIRDEGIDLSFSDEKGDAIIHYAAISTKPDFLKLLIKNETIDINQANAKGETPLIMASAFGEMESIQILLGHKNIDLNATTSSGFNALHSAVAMKRKEVVETFINHEGVDLKACTASGQDALQLATIFNCLEIKRILAPHFVPLFNDKK